MCLRYLQKHVRVLNCELVAFILIFMQSQNSEFAFGFAYILLNLLISLVFSTEWILFYPLLNVV